MDQVEIIKRAVGYVQGEKNRGKRKQYLAWFNEQMGVFAVTRQTFCNWGKGLSLPSKRILTHAVQVYPVDDARHQLAVELLALQKDSA